ncbi:MAG TPA: hypothetical protein VMT12_05785 [Syntrophales bacterium]|nr:hypothetical protein [Syntrophales bacterium]
MSKELKVRWGWLKGMYIFTIIHAGGSGLGIILAPNFMRSTFDWPNQDPIVFGICGSIWVACGLISILGLRSPLKFSPILLFQLIYKVVWFIGVILPVFIAGAFPTYATGYVVFFTVYIIGDLIAIPFPYVFAKETNQ